MGRGTREALLLARKGQPMATRRTTRTVTRNGVRIRVTTVTQTVPVSRTVRVTRRAT